MPDIAEHITAVGHVPNGGLTRAKPLAEPQETGSGPLRAAAAGATAAALLAACGGGGGTGVTGAPGAASDTAGGGVTSSGVASTGSPTVSGYTYPMPGSDEDAARFLAQAQFSASVNEIAALRSQGYAPWLTAQMSAPATQTGFDWLNAHGYNVIDTNTRYYDNTYPGDYMLWNQLMTSTDAPRKRVALALSEFFVVSLSALNFSWRSHGIAAWWDLLVANAFGNYRKLLEDVTLNAAMGYYLNTKGNLKENVATGRAPDENYGREVMQLFTIGLYQLNLDGTEKRDASGNKIETYTQADTTNIARVFTGWDFNQTQNVDTLEPVQNRTIPNTNFTRLPMRLTATNHSTLAASFLGATVAAGTDGTSALKIALDTLFNHPNVGPFFGKQMIQRLVTSNPSPAYVARVTAAFNNSGRGVRGDLGAVVRAILTDTEARSLPAPGFGKLREPVLRVAHWMRAFGATSGSGEYMMAWQLESMSERALSAPSVFGYFRPGYVPPNTRLADTGATAPEFQIVNESTTATWVNEVDTMVGYGLGWTGSTSDVRSTLAPQTALAAAGNVDGLIQNLSLLLFNGRMSRALQLNLLDAIGGVGGSDAASHLNRARVAVLVAMSSPEYLVQR